MTTHAAAAQPPHAAHATAQGAQHVGHVVPTTLLFGVLVVLLLLTWITVALSGVPLGALNVFVAMLIACTKATLVGMYFMHLRWDRPFNAIVLVASLLFVALFIAFTLIDTHQYQDAILPPREQP